MNVDANMRDIIAWIIGRLLHGWQTRKWQRSQDYMGARWQAPLDSTNRDW